MQLHTPLINKPSMALPFVKELVGDFTDAMSVDFFLNQAIVDIIMNNITSARNSILKSLSINSESKYSYILLIYLDIITNNNSSALDILKMIRPIPN